MRCHMVAIIHAHQQEVHHMGRKLRHSSTSIAGGVARMASMTGEQRAALSSMGGNARSSSLSAARRSEIARHAALARHGKNELDTLGIKTKTVEK